MLELQIVLSQIGMIHIDYYTNVMMQVESVCGIL